MSEKRFKLLSGGFDEEGNPLYLLKDTDTGFEWIGDFEICKKVIEQQATIKKLQDLCGQSDSENAKLRLKNKKLQDKIDMLCEKYDYPNEKDKTKVVKNDKQS